MHDRKSYKIEHELDFIRKLGTFSAQGKRLGRPELLKRYRETFFKRDWGGLDTQRIIKAIDGDN